MRFCEVQYEQFAHDAHGNISSTCMQQLVRSMCQTLRLQDTDMSYAEKNSYSFLDVQDMVSRAMHAQLSAELGALREERQQMIHAVGVDSSHDAQLSNAPATRIPTVAKKEPLSVLDVGSGEIGFNSFTMTADGVVHMKSFKIFIGLTGANREFYLKTPEPLQNFFCELETHIKLEWFVPSGEQEANCELSAVKYLALQTGIGKVDGVISGGGGSCQISCSRGFFPEVYSFPLGNKSPDKLSLFGEKKQDKLNHWYSLLGREIGKLKVEVAS